MIIGCVSFIFLELNNPPRPKAVPPNKDHLNTLLETNECVECDLNNANLSGVNLSGANLSGADLGQANLS